MSKKRRVCATAASVILFAYFVVMFIDAILSHGWKIYFSDWKYVSLLVGDISKIFIKALCLVAIEGVIFSFISSFTKKIKVQIGFIISFSALSGIWFFYAVWNLASISSLPSSLIVDRIVYTVICFLQSAIFMTGVIALIISIKKPYAKIIKLWDCIPLISMMACEIYTVSLGRGRIIAFGIESWFINQKINIWISWVPLVIAMILVGLSIEKSVKRKEDC